MVLDGLRVIDFSKMLAGPHCGMQLATLGAEVIKVELPGKGDDMRLSPNKMGGHEDLSVTYVATNFGKKSIAVDLKSAEGREIVKKLVATADVVIENMRTGVMDRLGFGYEDVKAIKPDIIYCSISGYGRTGPYATVGGYDTLAQATFGMMYCTGQPDPDFPPVRVGYSMTDIGTGINATMGILAAVIHRMKTGEGQHVMVSLMQTQMNYAGQWPVTYKEFGFVMKPTGTRSPTMAPYQAYRCKDGWTLLGCSNNRQWERICQFPPFAHLQHDPRYEAIEERLQHLDELQDEIEAVFKDMTKQEIEELMLKLDVPCAAINTMKEVMANEYYVSANFDPVEQQGFGPTIASKFPVQFTGDVVVKERKGAPRLGENTDDILAELGYNEDAVANFKANGIVQTTK